jgi:hypothetical protein
MPEPALHIRSLEGDFVTAECSACPFPEVCFEIEKAGTSDEVIAELFRRFAEHCRRVHVKAA